jgi:transcriptional regulator GlxA family with amidase domain
MKTVGLVIFDEVEVLDFAGPFEVFSITEDQQGQKLFRVELIGLREGPVRARQGLRVLPDRIWQDNDAFDVLVVPGGWGAEKLAIEDRRFLSWLKSASGRTPVTASVCTGAFLLAEAGILDGRQATTHHLDFAEFRRRWPRVTLVTDKKWVDEGPVVTSGGISSGIDMCLHLVARLEGLETAERTAARMEYPWRPTP